MKRLGIISLFLISSVQVSTAQILDSTVPSKSFNNSIHFIPMYNLCTLYKMCLLFNNSLSSNNPLPVVRQKIEPLWHNKMITKNYPFKPHKNFDKRRFNKNSRQIGRSYKK